MMNDTHIREEVQRLTRACSDILLQMARLASPDTEKQALAITQFGRIAQSRALAILVNGQPENLK